MFFQKLFPALFIFFSATVVFGQELTFGAKAGYITKFDIDAMPLVIGRAQIVATNGGNDGLRYALFGRADHQWWYLQAEAAYSYTLGGDHLFQIYNTLPDNSGGYEWLVSAAGSLYNRADITLLAGLKLLKRFRVYAGLQPVIQYAPDAYRAFVRNPAEVDSIIRISVVKENELNLIVEGLERSYHRYMLNGQLGLGLDLQGLTFDLTCDQSLTNMGSKIFYEGQFYNYRQGSTQWTFSIGYRLLPIRKFLLSRRHY